MFLTSRRAALAGLLLIAAVCVRLGFWQVGRLSERRAANAAAEDMRARPTLDLGVGAGRTAAELNGRWVEARGVYDRNHEVVIRGQAFGGTPGVHLATPLRLEGSGAAVMVLRGFVPAPDAVRANTGALVEPGTVRIRGLAEPVGVGNGNPIEHAGRTTWARLDLEALRERVPYPLLPVVVRQAPDSSLPRSPRRLPPPVLDDGPHLGYAIQWFLFAGMAVAFAVLVVGQAGKGARQAAAKGPPPMSS
ncbi:MAG: SURF1 family protein [Gemmatimonadales bacterium]|nr:SURF1 family protein [Gemmatimonadales bacterium]